MHEGTKSRVELPVSFDSSAATSAVMFDFDGVLVDSEHHTATAFREVINDMGAEVSENEAIEFSFGKSWFDAYAAVASIYPRLAGRQSEFALGIQRIIERSGGYLGQPIDSSIAALKRIALSIPVAIVSGSFRKNLNSSVESLGLTESVSMVVGAEDYHAGKPDPEPYLLAATRFEVAPHQCLVFEDSRVGIQAALAAGMHCIALKYNNEDQVSGMTVESLDSPEVYDFLGITSGSSNIS